MKAPLFILTFLITISFFSQNTYIPDDNFEQALIDLGYDNVLDDSVLTTNISSITSLNVNSKNISNLTGIEDFVGLTQLQCNTNQLTSLDVSNNTALTYLDCGTNQLTSLDISNNTALTIFGCVNNQLTSLDVSNNTALTDLYIYNNQLTSIDISNNTNLTSLYCSDNELTSIDTSSNTALLTFSCFSNEITNLDLSNNTALTTLNTVYNQLTNLNVSSNIALTELLCYDNQLTKLNVQNGNNVNLNSFNSTANPNLVCIQVDDVDNINTNWASSSYYSEDCYFQITITADSKTKVYGDVNPELTYQITSGSLDYGETLTGSLTRASGESVGTYPISSTLNNSNYTITYLPNNLIITPKPIQITADAKTKDYGDADPVLTYQITNGSLVNSDVLTGSLSRVAGETVGSYPIGSTLANSNYAITYFPNNLSITAKSIQITADAKTKEYGDADPVLTYQITNGSLVNSDVLTGSLTRVTGETVGNYPISSTLANSNYAITYFPNNLSITAKSIQITADAKTKNYGDTDPVFTYQITNGALVNSDVLTGGLTRATGETVGSYPISSTLANSNYAITYLSNNLNITARPIQITADNITKVYGDTDPTLTYQITDGNVLDGDEFTGSLIREEGETIGVYAINQGSLTLGANYTIDYISGEFTVTAAVGTIDYFVSKGIKVYPNPVSHTFYLEIVDNLMLQEIQLYNIEGKLVKTQKKERIQNVDVKDLSKGVYFLKIYTNKGIGFKKIVKN